MVLPPGAYLVPVALMTGALRLAIDPLAAYRARYGHHSWPVIAWLSCLLAANGDCHARYRGSCGVDGQAGPGIPRVMLHRIGRCVLGCVCLHGVLPYLVSAIDRNP